MCQGRQKYVNFMFTSFISNDVVGRRYNLSRRISTTSATTSTTTATSTTSPTGTTSITTSTTTSIAMFKSMEGWESANTIKTTCG
jgi:hypothetical protein